MDWYYVEGGQRLGPISNEQFEKLVREGNIGPESMVWKEGMQAWQSYSALMPKAPPPILGAAPGTATCAECGRTFPITEMVPFQGAYVCAACKPIFVQRLKEGAPMAGAARIWRSDNAVAMAVGAQLPSRCAKCNVPVTSPPIKRTLYWHAPWVYLMILLNVLIYLIVAMAVRKKAPIAVSLCEEHRNQRRLFISASWLTVLLGFALWVLAASSAVKSAVLPAVAGTLFFLAGIILGIWKGTLVRAKKIDERFLWATGFGRPFLASLPEWNGPA